MSDGRGMSGSPEMSGSTEMSGSHERSGSDETIWIIAASVLALGILFHGVRAPVIGWIPSGDDGYWSMMARSVLSENPPLLGSSSSGGVSMGTGFHHLGPLGFYLLAPFVVLFGSVGVAIGCAVINAVAAVGAAAAVRSGLGRRAGWVALVGTAALAATMGSELLIDPWNPHLATLPFWCACGATLAVLAGRTWWAAAGMAAASLALQTHLSFAPLSALLGVTILAAALFWGTQSYPGRGDVRTTSGATRGLRPFWLALGVTLLVNAPVLIQQLFGSGPGNLTQALRGSADQKLPIGRIAGLRVLSQPFDPLNWLPGSWFPQVIRIARLASPWLVVVAVGVVVVLTVFALRARLQQVVVRLGLVGTMLIVAGWVAGGLGFRMFGAPMTLARWAWPLALLWVVVVADAATRLWDDRGRDAVVITGEHEPPPPGEHEPPPSGEPSRVFVGAYGAIGLVLVVLLVGANLVSRDEGSGAKPFFRDPIQRMLDDVVPTVAEIDHPYIATTTQTLAAEATVALMDRLDEMGHPFTLDDPVALGQAGEYRHRTGQESATVRLRGGVEAYGPTPEGYDTIYRATPVSDEDLVWYLETAETTQQRLTTFLADMRSDPGLRARVDPAPGSPLDVAMYGWAPSLCGVNRELRTGSTDVAAAVISDADRRRLCSLDEQIFNGALAVDVGPPPAG